jgi:hypothetical protein
MKNARGIIALKIYGLVLGITALVLGLVGVAKSDREPGVITVGQFRSVQVRHVDRAGVLLYFGNPARPVVHVAQVDLAEATEARSECLTYTAQTTGHGYRFCFAPGTQTMASKQEVTL